MDTLQFIGAVMVTMWAVGIFVPLAIIIIVSILEKVSK